MNGKGAGALLVFGRFGVDFDAETELLNSKKVIWKGEKDQRIKENSNS